jgi:hypothetical protein
MKLPKSIVGEVWDYLLLFAFCPLHLFDPIPWCISVRLLWLPS